MLRATAAPNRKYSRQPNHLMNWYRVYLHDTHFSSQPVHSQPLLWRQSVPVFFHWISCKTWGLFHFLPGCRVFLLTPVEVNLTTPAEPCQQSWAFPGLCSALQTLQTLPTGHLSGFGVVSTIPLSILVTQA